MGTKIKYYIDIGTTHLKYLYRKSEVDLLNNDKWKIYCFEPSKELIASFKDMPGNVTFINKGVF